MRISHLFFMSSIILLSLTLIMVSDARNCIAKLSLEPSQVIPLDSSNIKIEISSSSDIQNITFASIILKIDPRLKVQSNGFSGTGFLKSAKLDPITDEDKYIIGFLNSNKKEVSTATAIIPVIAEVEGNYQISIEKAVLNDGERIIAEINPSDPLILKCLSPKHNSTDSSGQIYPEGDKSLLDTSCIEYDFPKWAYVHTPVIFRANVQKCSEIDSCILSYANSTKIAEWERYGSMEHVFNELPYGNYDLIFTVWNKDDAKSIPIEISIDELNPLGLTLIIVDNEKHINEPFSVLIKCNNSNNVDIQNVTVRIPLPEGIESYSGSDFRIINNLLETTPKGMTHKGEIFWKDIHLRGVKNITAHFQPVIDYSYFYNGVLINGSSIVNAKEIVIKSQDKGNIGFLEKLLDWIKANIASSLIILFFTGLILWHLNNVTLKIMGESREGIKLYNYGENHYDRAFDHFEEALKKDGTYFLPNYYCGMIKLKKREFSKAAAFFSIACDFYPPKFLEGVLHFFFMRRQEYIHRRPVNESFEILELMLRADDIIDPSKLFGRLKSGTDQISQHIVNHMSQDVKNLLKEYDEQINPLKNLKTEIVQELNRIILESQLPDSLDHNPINSEVRSFCIYDLQKLLKNNRDRLDQAFSGIIAKNGQSSNIKRKSQKKLN